MASALFQQYENDYCAKATDVSRKLQSVGPLPAGIQYQRDVQLLVGHQHTCVVSYTEQRRAKLREIEHEIKDAERVVREQGCYMHNPSHLTCCKRHFPPPPPFVGATYGHGGTQ